MTHLVTPQMVYKKRLIHKILDKVIAKKMFHRKRAAKFKMIDDVSDSIVVFLSTATTTSIVISLVTINPITAVVS